MWHYFDCFRESYWMKRRTNYMNEKEMNESVTVDGKMGEANVLRWAQVTKEGDNNDQCEGKLFEEKMVYRWATAEWVSLN